MAKKQIKGASHSKAKTVTPVETSWLKWGIFLFGFLLYANTITHDFTQDDAIVITENQYTQQGIQGIPGLLSKDTFFGFFKEAGKANLVSGGRYRPLTPIMFAIEYQIAGNSPWLGHLVNALLYGLTGFILFQFLILFLGKIGFKKQCIWIAGITTFIFLSHPLHTEVVANIKGRDEMMSFLFSILSLWATIKYLISSQWKYGIYAGLALFLALLSKENAITFVAVIPLALYLVKNNSISKMLKVSLPVFMAAIGFMLVRTSVLGFDFGSSPLEILNNPFLKIEGNQFVPFTFAEKTATILFTLGKYIQLFLFPHPLTHDYYPRHIEIMQWLDWKVLLSGLVYILLALSAIWGFRKMKVSKNAKVIFFGTLYYLITLSIVSNIIFPIGTNMSERFMYMPSLGLSLITGLGLWKLSSRFSAKSILLTTGIIVLLLSAKTITRNLVWKDNYTLFLTDINTSTRSAKLLNSVGGELISQSTDVSDPQKKDNMLREAQSYLRRALEIHPNYKLAYLLLGNSHYYLKEYDQAIGMYRQTVKLDDSYQDGRRNLGIALRDGGKYVGETLNDPTKALNYLLEAEKYLPTDSETIRLLGVCYGRLGQTQQAIVYFEKEISLAPNNASTYFNLAIAYQSLGNMQKAQENFEKAKSLDPEILNRNR